MFAWKVDLQLPVPTTTEVVNKYSVHGNVYSMPHYVLMLSVTCDSLKAFSFTPVYSTNKTYRHFITQILLKMVLNTINQHKLFIYC